ncbi:MAG: hypothetical protein M1821_001078 [Bathelium mastoideum]|nr:MAG: hypothetical protein M1821_001078 [Bathelium mastoideum]
MRRSVCLLLDWDGTLTQQDTTQLIGRVGSDHQIQTLKAGSPAIQPQDVPFRDPWNGIVQAYLGDLRHHQETYRPESSHRNSISEEQKWLESLSPIENRSIQRVEKSGIFKGVTAFELRQAGGKAVEDGSLHFRDGWDKLLVADTEYLKKQVKETDAKISASIISVSWSTDFIKGALSYASQHADKLPNYSGCDTWFLQRGAMHLEVHANDIDGIDRAEGSTGLMQSVWQPNIRTSRDKVLAMKELLLENGELYAAEPYAIYVGDSITDLECLLAADVGVCIRDEPMGTGQNSLADSLARINVGTRHVSEFTDVKKGEGKGEESQHQIIFWAHDLGEVARLVQGVLRSLYA